MATIDIKMAGVDTSFEIADVDALRILQAYTVIFTTQGTDADGNPEPVVPTPQQCVHLIAQSVVDGLAANTVRFEQEQAAAQARDAVPPLPIEVVPVA